MYGEKDVIQEDIRTVLLRNGFSTNEFKITVENGSAYDPHQIVSVQIWVTIERNLKQKKYGVYHSNWPSDFEKDLENGYFSD